MAASTAVNLNINGKTGQLSYTNTISSLSGGLTPNFPLTSGCISYEVTYMLNGAGSLQMQKSDNDPRESLNTATPIPQLWANIGTASTGATVQTYVQSGPSMQVRGNITGGSGTDVFTITIVASYSNT